MNRGVEASHVMLDAELNADFGGVARSYQQSMFPPESRPSDMEAPPEKFLQLDKVWTPFAGCKLLEAADPHLHGEFNPQ